VRFFSSQDRGSARAFAGSLHWRPPRHVFRLFRLKGLYSFLRGPLAEVSMNFSSFPPANFFRSSVGIGKYSKRGIDVPVKGL
jgi:hypothetical protein